MYKYLKQEIELDEKGNFVCLELGLSSPTLPELKEQIKAQQVQEKALPVIDVFFKARYSWNNISQGTTTGKRARTGRYSTTTYVWVSWKDENGEPQRQQIETSDVFPTTEENKKRFEQMATLQKKINKYQELIDTIEDQKRPLFHELQSIKVID